MGVRLSQGLSCRDYVGEERSQKRTDGRKHRDSQVHEARVPLAGPPGQGANVEKLPQIVSKRRHLARSQILPAHQPSPLPPLRKPDGWRMQMHWKED